MQHQLNHSEFKERQSKRKNNIIFILENLEHMENIGSCFRLADAFFIDKIIIVSNKIEFNKKLKKTARNCEKTVDFFVVDDIARALDYIKKEGYMPFNLEITSTSVPLRNVDFSTYNKVALIVGNEKKGIEEKTLNLVKDSVHIDMYGKNSSMNVITALSIATYKISEDFLSKKWENWKCAINKYFKGKKKFVN